MRIDKKQNFINLFSNLFALIVQFTVNFLVVPKIIKDIGTEAIGYTNLSNDIVSYFTIITVIFNSVAGRFITIELNKNDTQKASAYLNSVLFANGIISMLIAVFGTVFIPIIDRFIKISPEYLGEVKLTFVITFLTSILSLMVSVLSIGTYATNKLNVNAYRNIFSYLIRLVMIFILFTFFPVKVYFMPLASLGSTVFLAIANFNLTKKYLPELKFNLKLAKFSMIKELSHSGIWMSVIVLSGILMRNVDTLLSNYFFNQEIMGNLSTARTIPNAIAAIVNSIGTVLTPTFVALYSKKEQAKLLAEAKNSIRINGLLLMVPISGFIAFMRPFYNLWIGNSVSKETMDMLIVLSTIIVIQSYFDASTMAIAQLSIVTNRLKATSFVSVLVGIVNIVVEIVLLKTTDLGIIVLALPTTILVCLRFILFNPWYAAHIINENPKHFYLTLLRTSVPIPILIFGFSLVEKSLVLNSWVKLIGVAGVCGIIGYIVSAVIVLPKKELTNLISKATSKIKSLV